MKLNLTEKLLSICEGKTLVVDPDEVFTIDKHYSTKK